MEFRITLDREAFKVLASDTRLDILKALDERPMTVSELGRKLELNKATVFEHLERLVGAGLVQKQDEGDRKWVYYQLSWKARRILHPERVTIALLFSTALGALLSGVVLLAEYARLAGHMVGRGDDRLAVPPTTQDAAQAPSAASSPPPESGRLAMEEGAGQAAAAASAADPALLYAGIALLVMVALLVGIALWYRQQARRREAAEARPTP